MFKIDDWFAANIVISRSFTITGGSLEAGSWVSAWIFWGINYGAVHAICALHLLLYLASLSISTDDRILAASYRIILDYSYLKSSSMILLLSLVSTWRYFLMKSGHIGDSITFLFKKIRYYVLYLVKIMLSI